MKYLGLVERKQPGLIEYSGKHSGLAENSEKSPALVENSGTHSGLVENSEKSPGW